MALIRCTCIYRPSTSSEIAIAAPVTLVCRDPSCAASYSHERADRARAEAASSAGAGRGPT